MRKILLFIFLIICSNAQADFNTGDTFGKGLIIQSNDVTQTGGGRTLNFASGITVTNTNNKYNISASGSISGSGTSGQITYWTGTSSIGSLDTSTYPSLTELSYVKGVTSAIQTQINAKGNVTSDTLTANYIPKASGASGLTNSRSFDDGTNFVFGTNNSTTGYTKITLNTGTSGDGMGVNQVISGIGGIDGFTTLMLHMDGTNNSTTFTDSEVVSSAKSFTATGNAKLTTTSPKFGTASGTFDATANTYIKTTSLPVTEGTLNNPLTIDVWLNPTSVTSGTIASQCTFDGSNCAVGDFYMDLSSGNIRLLRFHNTSGNITFATSTLSVATGSWQHISAQWKSNGHVTFSVDGTYEDIVPGTGSASIGSTGFWIGSRGNGSSLYNGKMDEFRISDLVNRYTANFTPPASAYTDASSNPCYSWYGAGTLLSQICTNNITNKNSFIMNGTTSFWLDSNAYMNFGEGINIIGGTTTGTKIGTGTTQKFGFYNATPIVQPGATTDLGVVLSNLGLRASGTAYPITTSGAVTLGSLTSGRVPIIGTAGLLGDDADMTFATDTLTITKIVNSGGRTGTNPSAQTIADTNTITADACGGVKRITSSGAVTTNTTNTFTAPATGNSGCMMFVWNTGANNITLDNNANFETTGGADVVLTANDGVWVVSSGSGGKWKEASAIITE